jgi:uncharacterized membrane protein YfcA
MRVCHKVHDAPRRPMPARVNRPCTRRTGPAARRMTDLPLPRGFRASAEVQPDRPAAAASPARAARFRAAARRHAPSPAAVIATVFLAIVACVPNAVAAGAPDAGAGLAWWVWPLALFVVCFALGIVAVPAGVGGGVLFVPIVGGFFPFHLDFVRGAGLLVALASALAAGPNLLRVGLADLRLALPLAVLASASSIVGALVGLALPSAMVQTALGITILAIVALMASAKKSEFPEVAAPDRLSAALAIHGVFHDVSRGENIHWQVRRTPLGLVLFTGIGVLAGMFGLGAGWANVPVLNLVMGAPLKVSAGTSSFILSLVDSSAAWVYLNQGAVLAIVAVPSVAGMMLGARIGARLLTVLKASVVRRLVLALLTVAGVRALLKGLGIWV